MLLNYLKVAIRSLNKNRAYSAINILGLALGLCVSIIVFLFVKDELSYDTHYDNYQNIYRISLTGEMNGKPLSSASSCNPMAHTLRTEVAEVESATRIRPVRQELMLKHGEKKVYIEHCMTVDSTYFKVFDQKFISGDPNIALKEDNSIVLTANTAQRIFGDKPAMGEIVRYDDRRDLIVRGIVEEPIGKSHFKANFFVVYNGVDNSWISNNFYTYVKTKPDVDPTQFHSKISDLFYSYLGPVLEESIGETLEQFMAKGGYNYDLEPLTDIHLHSDKQWDIAPQGDIMYVYVFIAIAILVLLIAGINYMNLSTARSAKRAKEVGIRKVSGATKGMLISQFMIESILISFIAMFFAFILAELFLPIFNRVLETDLQLLNHHFLQTFLFTLGLTLFYGLFSGSYPALFLSNFKPITVLNGDMTKTKGGALFRKVLVVGQFAASIILITSMIAIYMQMSFLHNKDIGFEKEQVLVVPIQTDAVTENFRNLKQEFLKLPNVDHISRSSYLPGDLSHQTIFRKKGSDENLMFWFMGVDFDFIETLNLELVAGRAFQKELDNDSLPSYIINETAAKSYGFDEPVGKIITPAHNLTDLRYGKIVGVVKDFHFEGFSQAIKPMVLFNNNDLWFASIKIKPENASQTIAEIEDTWNRMEPSHPFTYTFLDDKFGALLKQQDNFGRMFLYLTILAILISCMGLYGLASYTAEQRTKEIGIRKVLGASIPKLMTMLTKDFIKLVLIANLFAWPITFMLIRNWLSDFSYQIDMPYMAFIAAAVGAIIIAIITVSYQAYQAANSDPINALKYE